jgi:putative hydrolase of the HAD superfamily
MSHPVAPGAPKRVRQVIFDLGGVLLEWNPRAVLARFYADEALQDAVHTGVFRHPDWLEMDRGTLEEVQAVERFAARTQRPATELSALMAAVRESLIPLPESIQLVRELSTAGVPLYAISNIPAATFDFLRRRYTFWNSFRGFVISGEIKMLKPEERIFRHAISRFALDPAQTVFIDDHAPNIEAAARLGFATILFEGAAACRRQLAGLLADWRS